MIVKNGKAKDDDGKGDEREAALLVVVVLFDVEGSLSPSLYPPIPVPLTQYLFQTSGVPKRSASLSENVRSMHFVRPPSGQSPRLMVSLADTFTYPTKGASGEGGRKRHTEYKAAPVAVNCIT